MPRTGLLAMAARDFERTCLYGRGKQLRADGACMLQAVPSDPPGPESMPLEIRRRLTFWGHVRVCQTCGYIEFTDV